MEWFYKKITNTKIYQKFIAWSKTCVLPVFSPLPLHTIGTFFFKEINEEALNNKASSLSYNFMLAIFPGIMFLFTLIPFIPVSGFQDQLLSLIELILPNNAYSAFESTLADLIKNQNGGLLSFGFFFTLFFATNGVSNLMNSFNKASLIIENRSWFRKRLIALTLTIIICLSIIVCISAMVFGEYLIGHIEKEISLNKTLTIFLIQLVRWTLLGGLYFLTISILYRYGPANNKKWKLFSPGSWLATILAFLTIWGFSFYINNFGSYNKIYGSIGTLMVIMIWLYLNSLILLIGFELNASVDLSRKSVKIIKPTFNVFKSELPKK